MNFEEHKKILKSNKNVQTMELFTLRYQPEHTFVRYLKMAIQRRNSIYVKKSGVNNWCTVLLRHVHKEEHTTVNLSNAPESIFFHQTNKFFYY